MDWEYSVAVTSKSGGDLYKKLARPVEPSPNAGRKLWQPDV